MDRSISDRPQLNIDTARESVVMNLLVDSITYGVVIIVVKISVQSHGVSDQFLGPFDHILNCKSVISKHVLGGGRCSEAVDRERVAVVADVLTPAE